MRGDAYSRAKRGFFPIIEYPIEEEKAKEIAKPTIDRFKPKAIVAIERTSANEKGIYSSLHGTSNNEFAAKLDYLWCEAYDRGILTVGCGDAGNELGMGPIRETMKKVLRYDVTSVAPCHIPVPAAISDLGAFGITACLSALLNDLDVLPTSELTKRIYTECVDAGAFAAASTRYGGVAADWTPAETIAAFVEIMRQLVRIRGRDVIPDERAV